MASSKDYLEYVLELLRKVSDITYKKMMGEYMLYKNGILFGGVYVNRFLVKKTKSLENSGLKEQIPYPSSMSKVTFLDSCPSLSDIFPISAIVRFGLFNSHVALLCLIP